AVSGTAFGVRLWFLRHMIAFDWKQYVIATLAPAVALSVVACGLILALRLFIPPESIRAAMIGVAAIVPTLLAACWVIGLTTGERHFLLEMVRKNGALAR